MPDPAGTPESSDSVQLAEKRACVRCGYDLADIPARHRVLTCPECGLKGRPRDVIRRPARKLPWWKQFFWMSGPCFVCFGLATAATIMDLQYGHRWVGPAGVAFLIVGLLSGILLPPIIATMAIRPERRRASRIWFFFAALAAGWAANFLSAIAMMIITAPLIGAV